MLRKLLFILIIGINFLWGCDSKEKARLQSQVDSLRRDAEHNRLLSQTLGEVGALLDSIDLNRNILRTEMAEGTSFSDYADRLKSINIHIKDTQQKLADLEQTLVNSKATNKGYLATIKRLQSDLASSTLQAATLQKEVETIRVENAALAEQNNRQIIELTEKAEIIKMKENDFAALEARTNEITAQAKTNQADLYFAQAQALETAAQRTRFAPKKKKEAQREALELYKVALSLGKIEAQKKIEELQKVIG